MPEPEVIRVVLEFRRRLLALDAAASAELVAAYGPLWTRTRAQVDSLLAEVATRDLTWSETRRLGRLTDLLRQVQVEVAGFSRAAGGTIERTQRAAVGLSQAAVRRTVDAALPPAIDTQLLARQGIAWTTLPSEAFEVFVGLAGDDRPLGRLLRTLGAEASVGVKEALGEGILQGLGPIKTARLVQNRFGLPLTRALTISRTETLRSYREASRLQYMANRTVVKGYRRVSAKDDRVCMACVVKDGQEYALEEPLDEHVNGRCALVPITVTYRDLGLNVDDPREERESALEWFEQQDAQTQAGMLGRAKYNAWQEGAFELKDIPKIEQNVVWGPQAVEKTLAEVL